MDDLETALEASAKAQTAADRIAMLETGVGLYAGPLLPGFYSDWVFPEQLRMEELFSNALRKLVTHYEAAGDYDRALHFARISVGADPHQEDAHREIIRLCAAFGRVDAALRQYEELERILKEEMDLAPSGRTQELINAIRLGEHVGAAIASPPEISASVSLSAATEPKTSIALSNGGILRRSDLLEPVGGALPLHSRFYISRPADNQFKDAIHRCDSILLIKGPRQVGKTSLLARGLQEARDAGSRVVMTNAQLFNAPELESANSLLLAMAEMITEQLNLDISSVDEWDSRGGPNSTFRRFLRRKVLSDVSSPLVWGLDEVDRLFTCPFSGEIFAMFRSWHDERALDPKGPWAGLTLAMAYSTEAHLFITDLNQSPFNVGTRLPLEDFSRDEVADLNTRYGSPLASVTELDRFYSIVGGQPYLVQRGLHELVSASIGIATFAERADSDDWIYSDHLRRIVHLLARNDELSQTIQVMFDDKPCPSYEALYRLNSAGIVSGNSPRSARVRCKLYEDYLRAHLPGIR